MSGMETPHQTRFHTWDEATHTGIVTLDGQEVVRRHYDTQGRLVKQEEAEHTTTYQYDDTRHLPTRIATTTGMTRLIYDDTGNLIVHIDEQGLRTETRYNARGQPVSLSNSLGAGRTYTYNAQGLGYL